MSNASTDSIVDNQLGGEAATIIALRHVTKVFRTLASRACAIRDLSAEVHRGEAVGVVGPNGSGKSTLILLLLGYLRPTHGTVSVFGQTAGRAAVRPLLGWMPDRPQMLTATGKGLLTWWLKSHCYQADDVPKRLGEMAARFGLSESLDRPIGHYSLGMRRKLSFLLATIHEPSLVLLDEPYLALDSQSVTEMRAVLEAFHRNGGTLLVASHQQGELSRLVDRSIELGGGQKTA